MGTMSDDNITVIHSRDKLTTWGELVYFFVVLFYSESLCVLILCKRKFMCNKNVKMSLRETHTMGREVYAREVGFNHCKFVCDRIVNTSWRER